MQVIAHQRMRHTSVHWYAGDDMSVKSRRVTDANARLRRSTKGSAGSRQTAGRESPVCGESSLRHLSSVEEVTRIPTHKVKDEATQRLRI